MCPGSRSAPLARALLSAERAGRLRLHVRADERSAAFLALGLAAATGTVTPVAVTSGTAVANLLPAMVEATYSGVPLMALTADRPASYRGTGANQTIVQDRLFDDASVSEVDVDGTAPVTESGARALRARVDRLVAAALASGRGGAVHLNVRLVEPLVPDDDEHLPELPAGRGDGPWTELRHLAAGKAGNVGVAKLDLGKKTLVIAGSGAAVRCTSTSAWSSRWCRTTTSTCRSCPPGVATARGPSFAIWRPARRGTWASQSSIWGRKHW